MLLLAGRELIPTGMLRQMHRLRHVQEIMVLLVVQTMEWNEALQYALLLTALVCRLLLMWCVHRVAVVRVMMKWYVAVQVRAPLR